MGKYVDVEVKNESKPIDTEASSSNGVKMVHASKQVTDNVKSRVQISDYFYSIIVPQLGSYYSEYPVDFDVKPVVCCPLHDENTPSFRYYEETNSFFCFGCRKGGNVVTLHRLFAEKMNGEMPSYGEAVNYLNDYFLKGQDTKSFINIPKLVKTKKNTDAEIVEFNIYRYDIENSISFDSSIKIEDKERIWSLLDNIDLLLSKDLIKCKEAKQEIQKEIAAITSENQ